MDKQEEDAKDIDSLFPEHKPVVVNGLVNALHVYYPQLVTTTLLKTWSIRCGFCTRDFIRFSFIGRPKCPHCGIRNHPNFKMFI